MVRGVLVVAVLAAIAPASQASDKGPNVREQIARDAARAGIDPAWLFAQSLEGTIGHADGRVEPFSMRLDDAIVGLDASTGPRGAAPTDVNAGNLFHVYVHLCSCSSALRYTITSSSVVPSTPPAGAPPYLFDVGGPLRQVKGGGWLAGVHSTGSLYGSNVDTSAGAPTPFPVWVPVATAGAVFDSSIDFIGHALVGQAQFCFFGFCVAAGGLIGDGATLFNNTTTASIPTVP